MSTVPITIIAAGRPRSRKASRRGCAPENTSPCASINPAAPARITAVSSVTPCGKQPTPDVPAEPARRVQRDERTEREPVVEQQQQRRQPGDEAEREREDRDPRVVREQLGGERGEKARHAFLSDRGRRAARSSSRRASGPAPCRRRTSSSSRCRASSACTRRRAPAIGDHERHQDVPLRGADRRRQLPREELARAACRTCWRVP